MERGSAEPLMRAVARHPWSTLCRARGVCRMWRELLERWAATRFVDRLTEPHHGHPNECDASHLVRMCAKHGASAAWVTTCLATEPPRRCTGPACTALLIAVVSVACPGFVAAIRRHVQPIGSSFALQPAAQANNHEMVEWLASTPLLDIHAALAVLRHTTDRRIVRSIAKLFDLRAQRGSDCPRIIHEVGLVLVHAVETGDEQLCDALHRRLGFRPGTAATCMFEHTASTGRLAMARWIERNIGQQALTSRLLARVAGGGHLETLQWLVGTFDLDGSVADALSEATEANHLAVVRWLVEFFQPDVHADDCWLLRAALGKRSMSVFAWLLQHRPVGWRALGQTEDDARANIRYLMLAVPADSDGSYAKTMLLVAEGLGLRAADL